MVFNLGYATESFPFIKLAIGAILVWAGLNISIVVTSEPKNTHDE